ncbi:MAG: hypothetical protein ACR2HN_04875 [Tepidiformaceae bacterium]
MTHRLTIVLDDAALYRRMKLRALEEGVPAKQVVVNALEAYLEGDAGHKPWDWAAFDAWQAEVEGRDAELGPGAVDLSDVKHHLYGYDQRGHGHSDRPGLRVAEEAAEYDAR